MKNKDHPCRKLKLNKEDNFLLSSIEQMREGITIEELGELTSWPLQKLKKRLRSFHRHGLIKFSESQGHIWKKNKEL